MPIFIGTRHYLKWLLFWTIMKKLWQWVLCKLWANFSRWDVWRNWIILRRLQWWTQRTRMTQHQSRDKSGQLPEQSVAPSSTSWNSDFLPSWIWKTVWQESFLHLLCCFITLGGKNKDILAKSSEILHRNGSTSTISILLLSHFLFLKSHF